jgi:tetratricopeptide (TPR) repeat protein
MWFRHWNERARVSRPGARDSAHGGARADGYALSVFAPAALLALVYLAGCSSSPTRGGSGGAQPPQPAAAHPPPAAPGAAGAASAPSAGDTTAPVHPDVPDSARADFERAVIAMRNGDTNEAELGFNHVALEYPQFAAPLVNLAILQRNSGQLEQAENTLKSAVEHESGSAVAWTELGATQRLRGQFKDASASYEKAIAADPHYAPAWRNLGVLSDLYLDDPKRALSAFEQYKKLSGEEEPVNGWIAELRQRLGLPPVKRAAASSGEGSTEGSSPAAPEGAAPAAPQGSQPAGAPGDQAPPAQAPEAAPSGSPTSAPAPQQPEQGDAPANTAAASATKAGEGG